MTSPQTLSHLGQAFTLESSRSASPTAFSSVANASHTFASFLLEQLNKRQPNQNYGPKLPQILTRAAPSCDDDSPRIPQDNDMALDEHEPSTAAGCRTQLCQRHQRMVDGGQANSIQKSIEKLSIPEQTAVNQIWSQFASAPGPLRQLILHGLLTICCPSQLSFLTEQLKSECRCDPLSLLPREISLKIMGCLDATSLCRAAQVSKLWRCLAENDSLWKDMCAQHIEKKCEKCGWGLPLMQKKRARAQRYHAHTHGKSTPPASRPSSPLGSSRDRARSEADSAMPLPTVLTAPEAPMTALRLDDSPIVPLPPDAPPPGAPAPAARPSSYAPIPYPQATTSRPHFSQTQSQPATFSSTPRTPFVPLRRLEPRPAEQFVDERPSLSLQLERPLKRTRDGRPNAPSGDVTMDDSSPTPASAETSPFSSLAFSKTLSAGPRTRPWKSVYSERLIIERNWRKGSCRVQVFSGHTDAVTCLQVEENMAHPNFPILMSGSWDRTVRVWNLETGECLGVLRGHERGIRALQFDANKLITGSMDRTLKIWNWRTGECLRTLTGHEGAVTCLAAERNILVSGSADSTVRVWNFDTGTVVPLLDHTEWVNRVIIWSPEDSCRTSPTSFLRKSPTPTTAPDSSLKLLFSSSDDGTIRVWDLNQMICLRVLEGHVAQVQALQILTVPIAHRPEFPARFPSDTVGSTDGHSTIGFFEGEGPIISANTYSGFVSARDYPIGAGWPVPSASSADSNHLTPINFEHVKPLVISGSLDNQIKMWDVEQNISTNTMFGHVQGIWDLAADKLRIATASHDRTIKIWDTDAGKCMHTLVGHRGAVLTVKMTDDRLLSGSDDNDIRVWNFSP